jgi:PAS domain S-box-containing protein
MSNWPKRFRCALAEMHLSRVLPALVVAWCSACDVPAALQSGPSDRAGGELIESGAPPFVVLGTESLGLSAPATDLHVLPDGRLLLYAPRQIALGDGIRWEVFRQAPEARRVSTVEVAIDRDGQIFLGVPGGFSRVDFGDNGFWHLTAVANWPATERPDRPVPRQVIQLGDEWIWHSGSGSVLAWHPGQPTRVAGQADLVTHVFNFQGQTYLSSRTNGQLYRLQDGATVPVEAGTDSSIDGTVTCSQPYADGAVLVGTFGRGLQLFDGHALRPFLHSGLLAGGLRIDDLCQTEGGLYAAAIEGYGIVFFARDGRTIQVLDRSLDHRLSRVKKLLPAPGGVIWGLLEDGVLRVEFPTRTSNFESVIGTGVTAGNTDRLDGKLWILVNGKTSRGVYDEKGRLAEVATDSPADSFVSSFSTAPGVLVAGTDHGGYFRGPTGWERFAPDSINLRILGRTPVDGRWLYSARNEIGWLRPANGGIAIERIPVPGLGNVYSNLADGQGQIWLELGSGRVGRIRLDHGRPVPELFNARDGVPDGWPQVFAIGGTPGFNIADHLLRFDESSHRFVPDADFGPRFPGLSDVFGRPGLDAHGRLWITANGGVQVLENRDGTWQNLHERLPAGLRANYFTFEPTGVVWLHAERHLVRYDPALPVVPAVPLRAIITHVNLVASNRTLFVSNGELPDLDYSDNYLSAHFVAPGNPFGPPVTFEVMLEGGPWIAAGSGGTAVFNRLKEGKYVLHVRPRAGDEPGREATVGFAIRPPWFRSPLAYVLYSGSALGLVGLAAWLITFLQRRENVRLENLVARRTVELKESNQLLARQVEEIRMLSQAIEQSPVGVFITQPDSTVVFANPRASDLTGYSVAELVGKNTCLLRSNLIAPELQAEIATTVERGGSWHGQLANARKDGTTVHVRTTISPIRSADGQIRFHLIFEEDISGWLADQDRRRKLEAQLFQSQKLESIGTLAGGIAHDFNNILTGILGFCELARFNAAPESELMGQLQEIRAAGLRAKDLVAQILTFSRRGTTELVPIDLAQPVAEALRLIRASTPATIAITSELESGTVRADSTQVQQVVLNLCTNAIHAIGEKSGRLDVTLRRIEVDARLAAEVPNLGPGPSLCLAVCDNGHGMSQATIDRIFDPFFTTKQQGEGTGLGLSIVQGILAGHQGALRVLSQPGAGSTFELYFPVSTRGLEAPAPADPAPRGGLQEILFVDDEPTVAAFATARLRQLGYRVTTFRDPREALAAYQATPNRFQALVTDLTMPHLTGLDLIQRIRSAGTMLPAIIITGYGRDAGGAKLTALPRCQVLNKPFSGEDLARLLNLLLGPGTP